MSDDKQVLCLFDILGFESLFSAIGLKQIKERYDRLVEYVREQTGGVDVVPTPDGHVAVGWLELGNAYFSDTILFWTKYSKMSLPSFTHLIAETICWTKPLSRRTKSEIYYIM
ncbi:acetamidase/formamidase [Candidatus Scalindua japonica]|uniref:Acetamidase/formamidase n=2 Tax=Candidatus Scalindua japonica TaxID=1284222 RepID=A0A286TWX2_9BACT|nr:acetamidase/formamidase [Candidatus Scalindua japonica]